jgi:hypothetical protein
MNEREREEKTQKLLLDKTTEELSYILGRYCGPSNTLLCEKQFGFILSQKIVQQLIVKNSIDDWLLSDSDTE